MSFPTSDALALIQSALLLLKEEPPILASPEDAAYFRTRQAKKTNLTPPPHPPLPKPPLPKNLSFGFDPTQNQGSFRNLDSEGTEPKT